LSPKLLFIKGKRILSPGFSLSQHFAKLKKPQQDEANFNTVSHERVIVKKELKK
jgi:hypothetical protein